MILSERLYNKINLKRLLNTGAINMGVNTAILRNLYPIGHSNAIKTAPKLTDMEALKQKFGIKTAGDYIAKEHESNAHNYHPIPCVLSHGSGIHLWDVNGRRYVDYLSAYSSVNQGHCHPRMVAAMQEQCSKLTLTSRAFHNEHLAVFSAYICDLFQYDKVLPMNSGVEAGETSIKLARKWAYLTKKVPQNEAVIVFAKGNFWGRSIAAVSSSTDPACYTDFGPFTPGFTLVPYDDVPAIKTLFERDGDRIAAFYIEPIQGEAGVRVPSATYFTQVRELCDKHNILLIADEIQTGLGRAGKMVCTENYGVRADIIVLGKALSGGMMPVSAVLCDNHIMELLKPGQHGSTYGGNPLGCRLAIEALQIIQDERLCDNAINMGNLFRTRLANELKDHPAVQSVRGMGLLNAIVCDSNATIPMSSQSTYALELCMRLMDNGILAKPTQNHIIRFAPPLVINEQQMNDSIDTIIDTFNSSI